MTNAERALLHFLIRDKVCELNDYEYPPSRAERRSKLAELLDVLDNEAASLNAATDVGPGVSVANNSTSVFRK